MSVTSFKTYRVPTTFVIALIPAAVALNVVGNFINNALKLPMFLEMSGPAVVAITIGPWWGALAGGGSLGCLHRVRRTMGFFLLRGEIWVYKSCGVDGGARGRQTLNINM